MNLLFFILRVQHMIAMNSIKDLLSGIFLLLTLLFVYGMDCCYGESIKFSHLSTNDGLSYNTVWKIIQDREGFIWIATRYGINRYDGYKFKVFVNDPEDSASISGNNIKEIYEDRNGVLWVGSENMGLNKFDKQKEIFKRFQHDPKNPSSLADDAINVICEAPDGRLWIGTRNGLSVFDSRRETFKNYYHDPHNPHSLSDNHVQSLHIDRSGLIWVGTWYGGLNVFDPKTGEFKHYRHDKGNPRSIGSDTVTRIYEDRSGTLWIGTWGEGLSMFDRNRAAFFHYRHDPSDPKSISSNFIDPIFEDSTGTLWIGTWGGGMNILDRNSKTFVRYQREPHSSHHLSSNIIVRIFEDRNGSLWISSFDAGIYILASPLVRKPVEEYVHNPYDKNSLVNNYITSIHQDHSGVLWFGTSEGLSRYDLKSKKYRHYTVQSDKTGTFVNHYVRDIYEDSGGRLWIGTQQGLYELVRNGGDGSSDYFVSHLFQPSKQNGLTADFILAIQEYKKDFLLIGTHNGLFLFDVKNKRFHGYFHDPQSQRSRGSNLIMDIYKDRAGSLWISAWGEGLESFDLKKGILDDNRHLHGKANHPSTNHIYDIYQDRRDDLWLSTETGLNRFTPKTGQLKRYTIYEGLPSNKIMGTIEDDQGYLWIATANGLSRLNPHTGQFINFDKSDGFLDNMMSDNALIKALDGRIFAGSTGGVNSFLPAGMKLNPMVPRVVITDILINNKPIVIGDDSILEKSIIFTDHLTMPYQARTFSFEFAALNFIHPEKNQYKYKMTGIDKEWIVTSSRQRIATYTHIRPGTYEFTVLASNNDGLWNEKGTTIKIEIIPAFWQAWWFISLCVAAVMTLAGYIYMQKVRELALERRASQALKMFDREMQKKNIELQAAVHQKEREMAKLMEENIHKEKLAAIGQVSGNIAHEIRNPLGVLRLAVFYLKKHFHPLPDDAREHLDLIDHQLEITNKIIAGLLRLAHAQSGTVTLERINLTNEIQKLADRFTLGERIKIHYDIESSGTFVIEIDPIDFQLLFVNLITNALQSMEDEGTIYIKGYSSPQGARCILEIEDTGCGIKRENLYKAFEPLFTTKKEGTGLGLGLCQQIMKRHGGEILLESQEGKGTKVTLSFPCAKTILSKK
jgi:ligand-binding sensor domain-containing protein/signal transduction histidine kinase